MAALVASGLALADDALTDQRAESLLEAGQSKAVIAALADARLKGAVTPLQACILGVAFADNNDIARAALYFETCQGADGALRRRVGDSRRAVRRSIDAAKLAPVSISIEPETARVVVSSLESETFVGSRGVWLPVGKYEVEVSAPGFESRVEVVEVTDDSRYSVLVRLRTVDTDPPAPPAAVVDLAADEPEQGAIVGPLDEVEHENLLPDRYRRGIEATSQETEPEPRRWAVTAAVAIGGSDISGDGGDKLLSYGVGAIVRYRAHRGIGVASGLTFVRKGSGGSGDSIRLDYVQIPVVGSLLLEMGSRSVVRLGAGAALGLLVAGAVAGQEARRTDPSILGEVAGGYRLSTLWLEVGARVDISLIGNTDSGGHNRALLGTVALRL